MARYRTVNFNTTEECHICGKKISNCGLGRTSHMRAHVRRGEALEQADYPRTLYFKIQSAKGEKP